MFPEGMDMNALLEQAQSMQRQMAQAQEELNQSVFEGSVAAGTVKASVNGTGELVGLEIKPQAVDLEDLESLSDLIVAAYRDAAAQASQKMRDLMPGLGGLGF